MTIISHYKEIKAYTTRDNSEIRELMHPQKQGNLQQSLAEANIHPGDTTLLHKHKHSEELYYITQGEGQMWLGDEIFNVTRGDCICIPAGTAHKIKNTAANSELKILCCCSPAYSHQDTELL